MPCGGGSIHSFLSVIQSVGTSVRPSVCLPLSFCSFWLSVLARSLTRLVGRSVDRLINQSVGRSVGYETMLRSTAAAEDVESAAGIIGPSK